MQTAKAYATLHAANTVADVNPLDAKLLDDNRNSKAKRQGLSHILFGTQVFMHDYNCTDSMSEVAQPRANPKHLAHHM